MPEDLAIALISLRDKGFINFETPLVSALPAPTIHPFNTELDHLIAASEVINSWVSIVRELVENAFKAQTTRLFISLMPELWQIRVADDGMDMAIVDLTHCAQPHSTCKSNSLDF